MAAASICDHFLFLVLSDQQVIVKVVEGSQSAILPCKTTADLSQDTTVEWTRSDVDFMLVHVYSKTRNTIREQDGFYRVRTMMNEDPLRTGDLSLTLKYPTDGDSGGYICTIYRDKDILRQKVVLQVKGQCSKCRSKVTATSKSVRVQVLILLFLLRTILGQSSSGSPGSCCGFWRSFILFPAVFHAR
uniref:Ig-like domain-containing protein n=1 Tax=Oreochromis niloticus TaxID=8128 RepID=A0A669EA58_ORENI